MPNIHISGRSEDGEMKVSASDESPGVILFEPETGGKWLMPADVIELFLWQARVNMGVAVLNAQAAQQSKLIVPDMQVPKEVFEAVNKRG